MCTRLSDERAVQLAPGPDRGDAEDRGTRLVRRACRVLLADGLDPERDLGM